MPTLTITRIVELTAGLVMLVGLVGALIVQFKAAQKGGLGDSIFAPFNSLLWFS